MKVRRPIQRKVEEPKTKPKRLDLNPRQLMLQGKVAALPVEEVRSFESKAIAHGPWLLRPAYTSPEGDNYYHPEEVALYLGWSSATVDNYTDRFLRIVRREGESAKEFRARKAKARRPEAPLVEDLPDLQPLTEDVFRLISARVLMFIVLAPAQVKGHHRDFIRELRGMSTLRPGRAQKIGATSPVTRWEVE